MGELALTESQRSCAKNLASVEPHANPEEMGEIAEATRTRHPGPWSAKLFIGVIDWTSIVHFVVPMAGELTGWETTRLSKHFILLDFPADHEVYRQPGRRVRLQLPFDEIRNDEHDVLARGLCNDVLEPLMMDERIGPMSVADAFWPSVFKDGHCKNYGPKHRWVVGEATVDIALFRLVDEGNRGSDLKAAAESVRAVDGCRDRVLRYPNTKLVCA